MTLNNNITAYQTIQQPPHTFDECINTQLKNDWLLFGEPFLHNGLIIQAMVKLRNSIKGEVDSTFGVNPFYPGYTGERE